MPSLFRLSSPISLVKLCGVLLLAGCAAWNGDFIASEKTGQKLYQMGQYDRALNLWKEAGEAEDFGAMFRLYEEYMDAKITERDVPLALFYLKKSAEGGDRRAQMEMGSLHDLGQGLQLSRKEAARWYLASARQGLPEAQYNIAVMYETGEGVPRNFAEAYRFYNLAIRNNFAYFAGPSLEALIGRMTPEEIQKGEALLK